MTTDDRTQTAALIALLSALLGALWGLQQGLEPQTLALAAGLPYGAALTLTGPLQAPLARTVTASGKTAGAVLLFTGWIVLYAPVAGWQLARGHHTTPKGVLA